MDNELSHTEYITFGSVERCGERALSLRNSGRTEATLAGSRSQGKNWEKLANGGRVNQLDAIFFLFFVHYGRCRFCSLLLLPRSSTSLCSRSTMRFNQFTLKSTGRSNVRVTCTRNCNRSFSYRKFNHRPLHRRTGVCTAARRQLSSSKRIRAKILTYHSSTAIYCAFEYFTCIILVHMQRRVHNQPGQYR